MISDLDLQNELSRQRSYIYNILNQGLPVHAGELLEFVKPLWLSCNYDYQYRTLYARIWAQDGL